MKLSSDFILKSVLLLSCLLTIASAANLEAYGSPLDTDMHCHACSSGNVIPNGQSIVYFGEVYDEMYVSSNGIISLGCDAGDVLTFSEIPIIAPYMSNIDTQLINNAVVDGTVFYRTEVGSDTDFDSFVLDNFGIPFQTIWEVVATYDQVRVANQTTPARNTFQVVVYVSAYGDTSVCYNYPPNGLNWPDVTVPAYPIVGFYSGPDLGIAYYLPGSGTPAVVDLDKLMGNFGTVGQFCYIVSGLEVLSGCQITQLSCRSPAFFPVNTPLATNNVLNFYSLCASQNLTIDTQKFTCDQVGDIVPVKATIGNESCNAYFIPTAAPLSYQNCPADITLYSNEPITADWIPPTIVGDCLNQAHDNNFVPNSTLFSVGTTRVSYYAYDYNYKYISCAFNVIVLPFVTVTYQVIDVLNRPIESASIGGNPDCAYTDAFGLCEVVSKTLRIGDIIPRGIYYVNFNGVSYAIPHDDVIIDCIDTKITLIISPPGFYRDSNGNILGCAPGSFSTIYEASSCLSCAAGTYNPDYYQISCENCPTGFYSAAGAIQCLPCLAGTYLDIFTGMCAICPAGTYSCDRALECDDCPEGSWSAPGSSECSFCSAGYYLDDYTNACLPCPAGFYSDDRAKECTKCPDGFFSMAASSECATCFAGYYLDINNGTCVPCPGGTISCDRALECTPCPTGGFAHPGSSSCSFCTAGFYMAMDESLSPCGCDECPAGTYSCDRAIMCEPCPEGYWSAPGSATCFSCTAGTYLDIPSSSCLACPGNTFSADRALSCTPCGEGSYSMPGSSVCTYCVAGYFFNNYTSMCQLCPAGTFSDDRAIECTPCPEGSFAFEGSVTCDFCTAGYFLDNYTVSCLPCPAGTISCDRATECTPCPDGSFSFPGSSVCMFCEAGNFLDPYSQLCEPCPAGTFSADRASACTNCPEGFWSQPGSSMCFACTAGSYLDLMAGACVACPPGTNSSDRALSCTLIPGSNEVLEQFFCSAGFYLEAATNSCLPCPPNTFSADRAVVCTACPAGSYSPIASTECSFCSAGTYLDVTLFNCFPCPANFFSPDRATQCFPCPFNYFSTVGSASCSPCPNNTVLVNGACQLCPAGSFFTDGVCVPCDAALSEDQCPFCPGGYEADIICSECCPGYYSPNGGPCQPCPDGSYSGDAALECVFCPNGTAWDERKMMCAPCD